MDTLKETYNQAAEKVGATGAQAKKEGNKEVAKDSDASLGDRASAAGSALSNKADETKHDAKSEGHKQAK